MKISTCKKLLLLVFPLLIAVLLLAFYKGIFVTNIEPKYNADSDTGEGLGYEGFINVQVETEGFCEVSERLSLYLCDEGGVIFVPSYVTVSDKAKGRIYFDKNEYNIEISGRKIKSGDRIVLSQDYQNLCITSSADGTVIYRGHLISMISENIPSVFITTTEHDLSWVDSDKSNREKAEFVCVKRDGKVDSAGEMEFHARGSSSFERCLKKSYRLNFEDDIDVLSMGKRESYVLQSNAFDSSKLRNIVSFKLAKELGMEDTCQTESVDVFVDGRYTGNYLLMECIDDDDYGKGKEADYLFGINTWKKTSYILAPENVTEQDEKIIDDQVKKMRDLVSNCRTQEDFEVLCEIIDLDSFLDMYIMNFLTDDSDANSRSTYYHFKNGKIYAGPAWDYDRTFGLMAKTQKDINLNSYDYGVPENMAEISFFRQALSAKIHSLNMAEIDTSIDEQARKNSKSVELDRVRWPGEEISFVVREEGQSYGDESDSDREESFVQRSNMESEAEYIKDMLNGKYDLMRAVTEDREKYARIMIDDNLYGKVYWVKKGDEIGEDFINWICDIYYINSLTYSDGTQVMSGDVINENVMIYTGTGGRFAGYHSSGF